MKSSIIRLSSLCIILLFSSGCSSNTELHRPNTPLVNWEEIDNLNHEVDGKRIKIHLEDGRSQRGKNFVAHYDSVEWTSDSGGIPSRQVVPIQRVLRIDVKPINIGRRIGGEFLAGGVLGFIGGMYVATASYDPPVDFGVRIGFLGLITGLGFAGGALYGLCDGVFSAIFGCQDRYYLTHSQGEVDALLQRRE